MTERQKGRRAIPARRSRAARATQPLVLPRLSAISAPCRSAGRVQKRRGRMRWGGILHGYKSHRACRGLAIIPTVGATAPSNERLAQSLLGIPSFKGSHGPRSRSASPILVTRLYVPNDRGPPICLYLMFDPSSYGVKVRIPDSRPALSSDSCAPISEVKRGDRGHSNV